MSSKLARRLNEGSLESYFYQDYCYHFHQMLILSELTWLWAIKLLAGILGLNGSNFKFGPMATKHKISINTKTNFRVFTGPWYGKKVICWGKIFEKSCTFYLNFGNFFTINFVKSYKFFKTPKARFSHLLIKECTTTQIFQKVTLEKIWLVVFWKIFSFLQNL